MDKPSLPDREEALRVGRKVRAYAVHIFTASGVIFAFLAVVELFAATPDPRWVFAWLLAAGVIDATDGPLARMWEVETRAPRIGGGIIDNIVDYLTFTFIPLLLVWRMGWVPPPEEVWVVLAMGASLFGFANTEAKQTIKGFFLGFPSYWNVVAFYAGLIATHFAWGAIFVAGALVVLSGFTVMPVRFVYPNRAPKPWRGPVIVGAVVWVGLLAAMLPSYPSWPAWGGEWLLWVSFIYPVFYFVLSGYLDLSDRQR